MLKGVAVLWLAELPQHVDCFCNGLDGVTAEIAPLIQLKVSK